MNNSPAFQSAATNTWRKRDFNKAYDALLKDITFASEAEAIKPENAQKTKETFYTFLGKMDWHLGKWCFDELLSQKTGEFEFRVDEKTPNWYHEFRECLYFLNFVRNGLLKEKDLATDGGTETAICILLLHDSWEDLGKNPRQIFKPLEEKTNLLRQQGRITEQRRFQMHLQAAQTAEGVDYLTRKTPVIGPDGEFVRKPNGKLLKRDRFGGNIMEYYNNVFKSALTTISKFFDGDEGMSTRIGVVAWSVDDDRKYANERRMLFGRMGYDKLAVEQYPFLKRAIQASDHMLGTLLVCMETVNDFAPGGAGGNPATARPVDIKRYSAAASGFQRLPACWHPIYIFMERMYEKARRDGPGVATLIEKAFVPALEKSYPAILRLKELHSGLPQAGLSGPNMA